MNFYDELEKSFKGTNLGIPIEGIPALDKHINGIQKAMMYGVAASPKVGKSTFVDFVFLLEPFLYAQKHNIPIKWIYFSFEMDRISKEFDFIVFFLKKEGYEHIMLPSDSTVDGSNTINITSSYLRGWLKDDSGNVIKISEGVKTKVLEIHEKYIVPLFGRYSSNGILIEEGAVNFINHKENPTGLRKKLFEHAEKYGKFEKEPYIDSNGDKREKIVSYKENNEAQYNIVITDTIRKIPSERGYNIKQTIDKYLEYTTEFRNMCSFTFIHIVHLNRSMADVNRLKFLKDTIYPSAEDVKDSGNLSEECNHLFTLFNPNDDKYNLTNHFGKKIKDEYNNILYPNMRTLHLVESRHVEAPKHFRLLMNPKAKTFSSLVI